MATNTDQNGFGFLGVLLLFVTVGLIIGAGVYVFGRNQAPDKFPSLSDASVEQAPRGEIEFPQLGVKMKLPEEIQDIQYVYMQKDGSDRPQDYLSFTSRTVKQNGTCGTDIGSLGTLTKFELSETVEAPNGERIPPAELGAVKVRDHLYLYETPRDSCLVAGNNLESDAALKKQINALKEAVKTLEAI